VSRIINNLSKGVFTMSRTTWYLLAIVFLLLKMPVLAIVFFVLGLTSSNRR
jgi:hypothetical protein